MDALPEFEVVHPTTLADVIKARAAHPHSRLLGGGADLIVNIRRGIEAPPTLIDVNGVSELRAVKADAHGIEIGASVTLSELAQHPDVARHYPVVALAAGFIAGPTHRNMGTVGGNLSSTPAASSTTKANGGGRPITIASRPPATSATSPRREPRRLLATFSGDLAPALLTLGAEVDLAGPDGRRTLPLERLYIGYARQDQPVTETLGDGKYYLRR